MSTFWKIEEAVGGGHYITLDGLFDTEAEAKGAIARHRNNDGMRAVQYERGFGSCGPIRVQGFFR
jgi:hypothetical protein